MSSRNADILQKASDKFLRLVEENIASSLVEAASRLLVYAGSHKEYHNLTGNTLTSYMAGIYVNGSLRKIVSMYDADMDIDRPTHAKLYRGDGVGVIYVEDYDTGRTVHVVKSRLIDTDKDYGENTSRRFLSSYQGRKGSVGIVICTGTEYSEFLEDIKRLDVLTQTFEVAGKVFSSCWKKIE